MKTAVWIVVLVLIAGVAYIVWPQLVNAPQLDEAATLGTESDVVIGDPTVTIAYTDAGFSPSTVTIKKGESVRFVNNSTDQETWPASAVHPTHSVYPQKTSSDCLGSAFDACRGIKSGGLWQFTFNEVGEWAFHDHLHPSKFGKIIVTE